MAVQADTARQAKAERVYPGHDIAQTLPEDQMHFLEDPFQYWVLDGVCAAIYPAQFPECWFIEFHSADEATTSPEIVRSIANAFWNSEKPGLLMSWCYPTDAAEAFATKAGFKKVGTLPIPGTPITVLAWRKCH